jgi:transcriptional regulator with XRE-family HTH domain
MSKESLGLLIRKLRKEKGFSLRELAEEMDSLVSHVIITHLENGRVTAKREVLVKLAEVLDCSVDELLAEVDQVGGDVADVIRKKADIIPNFLRSTKNLSSDDWKELSTIVNKMKEKK